MKKKVIAMMLICAFCISLVGQRAKAWVYYGPFQSEACTTDVSAYFTVRTLDYNTYYYDHVCGGDVKAKFTRGHDGLDSHFTRYTERGICAFLYEMDGTSSLLAAYYTAQFSWNQITDYYAPITWTSGTYNSYEIEDDGNVELQLRVLIESYGTDTSTAIPAELFKYTFGVVG